MTRNVSTALLFWICLLLATPVWGEEDPLLAEMMERFNALTNYTTLLDSEGWDGRNRIMYTYKKPGFIRMDFIRPYKGALLIYNPIENKVTLRPFSIRLFTFYLAPDNRFITDSKGHTVNHSDIGSLIRSVEQCAHEGTVTPLPTETLEGLSCPRLLVQSTRVTYFLWIHPRLRLPIKVVKFFSDGEKETVFLHNLTVDVPLDDTFFTP